jgi:hypothetical protein
LKLDSWIPSLDRNDPPIRRLKTTSGLQPVANGAAVVDVEPKRSRSPASQGLNNDLRFLGLQLAEIVIEPD